MQTAFRNIEYALSKYYKWNDHNKQELLTQISFINQAWLTGFEMWSHFPALLLVKLLNWDYTFIAKGAGGWSHFWLSVEVCSQLLTFEGWSCCFQYGLSCRDMVGGFKRVKNEFYFFSKMQKNQAGGFVKRKIKNTPLIIKCIEH